MAAATEQTERRRMLLGAVLMYNGSHALHGLWRHPEADHRAHALSIPDLDPVAVAAA